MTRRACAPAVDQVESAERHPPASSPGWAERSAPLRAFLATPRGRSWPELRAWAEEEGISGASLLNRLAWLENAHAVVGVGRGEALRWVATGQAPQRADEGHDVITSAPPLAPARRRRAG